MTEDDGARPTNAGRPSVLCSDVGLCPMLPSFTTKVKATSAHVQSAVCAGVV